MKRRGFLKAVAAIPLIGAARAAGGDGIEVIEGSAALEKQLRRPQLFGPDAAVVEQFEFTRERDVRQYRAIGDQWVPTVLSNEDAPIDAGVPRNRTAFGPVRTTGTITLAGFVEPPGDDPLLVHRDGQPIGYITAWHWSDGPHGGPQTVIDVEMFHDAPIMPAEWAAAAGRFGGAALGSDSDLRMGDLLGGR